MNTKKIPLFLMLLAGSVACIVTYLNHYNLHDMLIVLITVLFVFLILGVVIKKIFINFGIAKLDEVDDEGEVVEKQGEGNEAGESAVPSGEENQAVNPEDIASDV